MLRPFIFPVLVCQVGYSIIPYLLDWGFEVLGAVSKTFGCKSVEDNGDGFTVRGVVQVGSGSAPGMITDDSEIF